MDKIEKIRQEIERLKKLLEESTYYLDNSQQALGYSFALDDFNEFLDTLSEEPDKSLEEEIQRYLREKCSDDNEPTVSEIARHFAEWQKEQMMEEAVEYEVVDFSSSLEAHPHVNIPLDNKKYRSGDTVRVIVLPKED